MVHRSPWTSCEKTGSLPHRITRICLCHSVHTREDTQLATQFKVHSISQRLLTLFNHGCDLFQRCCSAGTVYSDGLSTVQVHNNRNGQSAPAINSTEQITVISLSIIIPVKNEARNLEACLRSIRDARSVDLAYEILVIDNGSEDNTVDVARKFSADVHVVPDVTVAALRNFGAERAQGEVLAFIDADCTLQPDWFDSILPYIKDDSIKCFGSPPGIPEQSTWVQECWYQIRKKGSPNDPPRTVEWLESMNLFIRRDVFNAVNGFDTSLETCEDYDLGVRLKQHGDIWCDSGIKAIHHGEAHNIKRFYEKERWRGVSNIEGLRKHGFSLAELPSLLFPMVQIVAILLTLITVLLAIAGKVSFLWVIACLVIWQLPLFIMGYRKSGGLQRIKQAGGIWTLLNVYFTARGQSLFMGAAWQ